MPLIPRHSSDAEIDAFADVCDRLGGFDDRISAEWADGYLTALAAGWRAVPFDEAVARLAGDAFERAFADPPDRERAETALRARIAVLADQLDPEWLLEAPDAMRLVPLMSTWDDAARAEAVKEGWIDEAGAATLATGAVWAEGFLDALADFEADWTLPRDADDAVFDELLDAVRVLAWEVGSDETVRYLAAAYDKEEVDRDRLVDDACFAVQDLRVWWLDHAPRPETRRVGKTPGRNDPCPCGSGRKYKKCHGAAA